VFVNRRPKSEIVPILRERLGARRSRSSTRLCTSCRNREGPMASLLAVDPYVTDWLDLLTRWLHVAPESSGCVVVLLHRARQPSASASRREQRELGIGGETWEIHARFYNVKKYLVAPRVLPETLHCSSGRRTPRG